MPIIPTRRVHALRPTTLFLFFFIGLFVVSTANASPAKAHGIAHAATQQNKAAVNNWLFSEFLFEALDAPITVELSGAEKAAIDHAPRSQTPMIVGQSKPVNTRVNFSSFRSASHRSKAVRGGAGYFQATEDGGFVYSLMLGSPGAHGLRVHFSDFSIPEDSELYLFTDDGQVAGPYWDSGPLGTGTFWSHMLFSDQVMLQLRYYGTPSNSDLNQSGFKVSDVTHVRDAFQAGLCSANESCVENAECESNSPLLTDLSNAVAGMIFQSGAYAYICSGGLIADTDTSYNRPLFLTANHCISKSREAQSLETYFQYTTPCGSTANCDFPSTPSTVGASIVSKGRSSDYTLLELSQEPPPGSHYLGWNPTPIATSEGTNLFRISHPSGSPQAYSEHEVDSDFVQCGGLPVGNFIYSADTFGATEGGSSGSPVVDSAGKIVGQLYGGCGYNINDVCDAAQNRTVDGAFASYFADIQDILDPQGCPATETICDDGIDNDCDGDIDLADSDCDVGGGFPAGTPCNNNSECASGKCKGRQGGMVCR